jgi:hypothetical protein
VQVQNVNYHLNKGKTFHTTPSEMLTVVLTNKNENKKYGLHQINIKVFLEWMLTAENHVQQNQCYAYSRTLLLPPMEHQEWLHQPTLEYKIIYIISMLQILKSMYNDCGLLNKRKSGTRLLAVAKWFISLFLCHNSSSLELMRQLIIADPDKKICIRKPTVQQIVQCENNFTRYCSALSWSL